MCIYLFHGFALTFLHVMLTKYGQSPRWGKVDQKIRIPFTTFSFCSYLYLMRSWSLKKNKNVLHKEHYLICRRDLFVTFLYHKKHGFLPSPGRQMSASYKIKYLRISSLNFSIYELAPGKTFCKIWMVFVLVLVYSLLYAHTLHMHMTLFDSWNCWSQPCTSDIFSRREICMFFFLLPPRSHSPPLHG
jgi:hypothetical protein